MGRARNFHFGMLGVPSDGAVLRVEDKFSALLGKLKESPIAAPARHQYWRQTARREQYQVLQLARKKGFPALNEIAAELKARAATGEALYICGNGDSVNELTSADLAEMQRGVSIGVMGWPIHRFIPTLYSLETGGNETVVGEQVKFLVEKALSNADSTRILMLRPSRTAQGPVMGWLSQREKDRIILYGRANLATRSERNLNRDIQRSMRALRKAPDVTLDNGNSVVRAISLGLLCGFRRIVLSGVDLNGGDYFWYNKGFIMREGDFTQSLPRTRAEGTLTLDAGDRPFPADKFIFALAEVAADKFGCEVSVSSQSSRLSKRLPVRPIGHRSIL